ncbi:TolC family protein [bacterium]|nr:TolC family protein [bacterium]
MVKPYRRLLPAALVGGLLGLLLVAAAPVTAEDVVTTLAPTLDPQDLSLQAAAEYALARNPELLAMAQEVRMAEANLRLARAADRIQASVNGYASAGTQPNMITNPPDLMPDDMRMLEPGPRVSGDVRVIKPLATGGRTSARISQRRHLLAATRADLETLRLDVYYGTRAAYRRCLLNRMLVDVRRKDVAARRELVRVDSVKLEAGKIPLYYHLRDKTRLADAEQMLVNAERDLEVSCYDLSVLMGLQPPQQLRLSEAMPGYMPTEQDADEALAAAAANRPELAALRARLAAADAGISAAQAAYHPQLAVAVIFDAMAGRSMSAGGYTAALTAGVPLVDGGSRAAEVAMARAQQQQLSERERQVALSVAREVLGSLANLKAADQNTRTALEARAAAEEDNRITRLRYDAGKAINLEPLDALAALVKARVDAVQALYEYNDAVDELHRAMGCPPQEPAPGP